MNQYEKKIFQMRRGDQIIFFYYFNNMLYLTEIIEMKMDFSCAWITKKKNRCFKTFRNDLFVGSWNFE